MKINTGKRSDSPQPVSDESKLSSSSVNKSENTSIIELPSKGKLYNGKSSVEVSFLTVADIKRIYSINQGTSTDSIERLLASKIYDFDAFDLTVYDMWFLACWIRVNSCPMVPIQVKWECQKLKSDSVNCGKSNFSEVRGSTLEVKEIDSEYQEPVGLTLPNYGKVFVRLPRVRDDIDTTKFLTTYKGDQETSGDRWLCNLLHLIDNSMSLGDKIKLTKENKITPDDVFYLSQFETEYQYGMRPYLNLKCEGCGEVSRIPFRLRMAHFLPEVRNTRTIRDAVTFNDSHKS
jgi:hypothetical protein